MTLTQTFVAGQKLRASQLTALVTGINAIDLTARQMTYSVVTSDQTVTNSSTLVNATGLAVVGTANTTWNVELDLMYQAPAANDFRPAWTWPAGSTFPWSHITYDVSSAFQAFSFDNTVTSGSAATYGGLGGGTTQYAHIRGLWTIGATPGTLQFQFSQWVSGAATSAVIKAGTVLRYQRTA